MGAGEFTVGLLVTFALTVYLVRSYGDPRISAVVQLLVLTSWFLSFSIVVVLPLDVSATYYIDCMKSWYCDRNSPYHNYTKTEPGCCSYQGDGSHCEYIDNNYVNSTMIEMCTDDSDCTCEPPSSWVNETMLGDFWGLVYWSAQLFTWLLLPITEAYMSAGAFTTGARLQSAFKENAIVYGSLLLIVIIVLVVYAIEHGIKNTDEVKQIAMIASNTWGLAALIIMLGVGLVDVPKALRTKASPSKQVRLYQFKAAKLNSELAEAEETHADVMNEVKQAAGLIKQSDPLRKYMNIILLKANLLSSDGDYEDYKGSSRTDDYASVPQLVGLHKKVMKSKAVLHRCECQMDEIFTDALLLQDTLQNKGAIDKKFVESSGAQSRFPQAKWMWEVQIKPVLIWALLIICTVISFLLVWTETVFGVSPDMSVYAHIVAAAGSGMTYSSLEFVTLITVLYMCVCTYSIIFKIRLFNFYYLVPNRQTDASSMLFASIAITRLTAPICLNFVAMCLLDGVIGAGAALKQDLYFTQIQGHLVLAENFNKYYPICVLPLIVCATVFKIGNKLLSFCGFTQYTDGDEDTDEFCSEGKILISREKRARERTGGLGRSTTKERLVKSPLDAEEELERGNAPARGSPRRGSSPSRYTASRPTKAIDVDDDMMGSDSLHDDMSIGKPGKKGSTGRGGRGGSRFKGGGYTQAAQDDEDSLLPSTRGGGYGAGPRGKSKDQNIFDDL